MVAKPKNDAEAEDMIRLGNEHFRAKAEERRAAQEARYTPLRDLVNGKEFAHVMSRAAELEPEFRDDDRIHVHLQHLNPFMRRLADAARAPAPTPPMAVAPTGGTEPAATDASGT